MASLAECNASEGAPSDAQNPAENSALSEKSTESSMEHRLKEAAGWKDNGNQLYLSKDYLGALEMYDTALKGTSFFFSESNSSTLEIYPMSGLIILLREC